MGVPNRAARTDSTQKVLLRYEKESFFIYDFDVLCRINLV